MNPHDLRQQLGLQAIVGNRGHAFLGALAAVIALIGDEKVEARAAWFDDYDSSEDTAGGVHIRAITATGVITLDYEFSFDGGADARFLPWSRVRALRVIAEPDRQTRVANAWLETDGENIEFAGAGSTLHFAEIVGAIRKHLV